MGAQIQAAPSRTGRSPDSSYAGARMDVMPEFLSIMREHPTAERDRLEQLLGDCLPTPSRSMDYADQVKSLAGRLLQSRDGQRSEVALLAWVLLRVLDDAGSRADELGRVAGSATGLTPVDARERGNAS